MMGGDRKVASRSRAREAAAGWFAALRRRELEVEEVLTRWVAAVDALEAAEAAREAARDDQAAVVAAMARLDLAASEIAEMCSLSSREVRQLQKRGSGSDETDEPS